MCSPLWWTLLLLLAAVSSQARPQRSAGYLHSKDGDHPPSRTTSMQQYVREVQHAATKAINDASNDIQQRLIQMKKNHMDFIRQQLFYHGLAPLSSIKRRLDTLSPWNVKQFVFRLCPFCTEPKKNIPLIPYQSSKSTRVTNPKPCKGNLFNCLHNSVSPNANPNNIVYSSSKLAHPCSGNKCRPTHIALRPHKTINLINHKPSYIRRPVNNNPSVVHKLSQHFSNLPLIPANNYHYHDGNQNLLTQTHATVKSTNKLNQFTSVTSSQNPGHHLVTSTHSPVTKQQQVDKPQQHHSVLEDIFTMATVPTTPPHQTQQISTIKLKDKNAAYTDIKNSQTLIKPSSVVLLLTLPAVPKVGESPVTKQSAKNKTPYSSTFKPNILFTTEKNIKPSNKSSVLLKNVTLDPSMKKGIHNNISQQVDTSNLNTKNTTETTMYKLQTLNNASDIQKHLNKAEPLTVNSNLSSTHEGQNVQSEKNIKVFNLSTENQNNLKKLPSKPITENENNLVRKEKLTNDVKTKNKHIIIGKTGNSSNQTYIPKMQNSLQVSDYFTEKTDHFYKYNGSHLANITLLQENWKGKSETTEEMVINSTTLGNNKELPRQVENISIKLISSNTSMLLTTEDEVQTSQINHYNDEKHSHHTTADNIAKTLQQPTEVTPYESTVPDISSMGNEKIEHKIANSSSNKIKHFPDLKNVNNLNEITTEDITLYNSTVRHTKSPEILEEVKSVKINLQSTSEMPTHRNLNNNKQTHQLPKEDDLYKSLLDISIITNKKSEFVTPSNVIGTTEILNPEEKYIHQTPNYIEQLLTKSTVRNIAEFPLSAKEDTSYELPILTPTVTSWEQQVLPYGVTPPTTESDYLKSTIEASTKSLLFNSTAINFLNAEEKFAHTTLNYHEKSSDEERLSKLDEIPLQATEEVLNKLPTTTFISKVEEEFLTYEANPEIAEDLFKQETGNDLNVNSLLSREEKPNKPILSYLPTANSLDSETKIIHTTPTYDENPLNENTVNNEIPLDAREDTTYEISLPVETIENDTEQDNENTSSVNEKLIKLETGSLNPQLVQGETTTESILLHLPITDILNTKEKYIYTVPHYIEKSITEGTVDNNNEISTQSKEDTSVELALLETTITNKKPQVLSYEPSPLNTETLMNHDISLVHTPIAREEAPTESTSYHNYGKNSSHEETLDKLDDIPLQAREDVSNTLPSPTATFTNKTEEEISIYETTSTSALNNEKLMNQDIGHVHPSIAREEAPTESTPTYLTTTESLNINAKFDHSTNNYGENSSYKETLDKLDEIPLQGREDFSNTPPTPTTTFTNKTEKEIFNNETTPTSALSTEKLKNQDIWQVHPPIAREEAPTESTSTYSTTTDSLNFNAKFDYSTNNYGKNSSRKETLDKHDEIPLQAREDISNTLSSPTTTFTNKTEEEIFIYETTPSDKKLYKQGSESEVNIKLLKEERPQESILSYLPTVNILDSEAFFITTTAAYDEKSLAEKTLTDINRIPVEPREDTSYELLLPATLTNSKEQEIPAAFTINKKNMIQGTETVNPLLSRKEAPTEPILLNYPGTNNNLDAEEKFVPTPTNNIEKSSHEETTINLVEVLPESKQYESNNLKSLGMPLTTKTEEDIFSYDTTSTNAIELFEQKSNIKFLLDSEDNSSESLLLNSYTTENVNAESKSTHIISSDSATTLKEQTFSNVELIHARENTLYELTTIVSKITNNWEEDVTILPTTPSLKEEFFNQENKKLGNSTSLLARENSGTELSSANYDNWKNENEFNFTTLENDLTWTTEIADSSNSNNDLFQLNKKFYDEASLFSHNATEVLEGESPNSTPQNENIKEKTEPFKGRSLNIHSQNLNEVNPFDYFMNRFIAKHLEKNNEQTIKNVKSTKDPKKHVTSIKLSHSGMWDVNESSNIAVTRTSFGKYPESVIKNTDQGALESEKLSKFTQEEQTMPIDITSSTEKILGHNNDTNVNFNINSENHYENGQNQSNLDYVGATQVPFESISTNMPQSNIQTTSELISISSYEDEVLKFTSEIESEINNSFTPLKNEEISADEVLNDNLQNAAIISPQREHREKNLHKLKLPSTTECTLCRKGLSHKHRTKRSSNLTGSTTNFQLTHSQNKSLSGSKNNLLSAENITSTTSIQNNGENLSNYSTVEIARKIENSFSTTQDRDKLGFFSVIHPAVILELLPIIKRGYKNNAFNEKDKNLLLSIFGDMRLAEEELEEAEAEITESTTNLFLGDETSSYDEYEDDNYEYLEPDDDTLPEDGEKLKRSKKNVQFIKTHTGRFPFNLKRKLSDPISIRNTRQVRPSGSQPIPNAAAILALLAEKGEAVQLDLTDDEDDDEYEYYENIEDDDYSEDDSSEDDSSYDEHNPYEQGYDDGSFSDLIQLAKKHRQRKAMKS